MKYATCALLLGALVLALNPCEAAAGVPEGKIAVVRVTAIDGLAKADGAATQTRASVFSFDGTDYTIARSALAGLDGVKTLVLVDRRKDVAEGSGFARRHSQEVRALDSSVFEVKDLPGRVLSYQVATVGGNPRILGDGDQIVCAAGADGPFHVWRIDSIDLVDPAAIHIR